MVRLTRRLGVLGLLLILAVGLAPVASAATWATFGTPSATSTYGTGVDFSQPVTVDRAVTGVELLLTVADALGPTVVEVPAPDGTGATTLDHLLDTSGDGHLLPNTPIVARWRLIASDDPSDVALGPAVRVTYADDRFTWQTEAGDLVRVHWSEGTAAFGRHALKIGEDGVRQASDLLGVSETKPVDFYVYADQAAFRDALGPGTRENVGGEADASIRTLFALIPPSEINDAWVGTVIPHELTHLVFDTATRNPYHLPPRWLNEGLAVYESESYDTSNRSLIAAAVSARTLLPLDGLVGQFPTSADGFFLAYAESVSAVDYLVRTYGSDALVTLIRSYQDGRTDDEAFGEGLGVDTATFAAAWLGDLGATAPTRYGPQPAPSGPIPSAWQKGPALPARGGDTGASVTLVILSVLAVGTLIVIGLIARHRRRQPAVRPAS